MLLKKREYYIEKVVDYYYRYKKSISLEELQILFECVYPNANISLTLEDWKVCDLAIQANYSKKVYDQFELVKKRKFNENEEVKNGKF